MTEKPSDGHGSDFPVTEGKEKKDRGPGNFQERLLNEEICFGIVHFF